MNADLHMTHMNSRRHRMGNLKTPVDYGNGSCRGGNPCPVCSPALASRFVKVILLDCDVCHEVPHEQVLDVVLRALPEVLHHKNVSEAICAHWIPQNTGTQQHS